MLQPDQLLQFIQQSFLYRFAYGLLQPIWVTPTLRSALLVASVYLLVNACYGGYMSFFTGGLNIFSLNRLGLKVTDLFNLAPAALATVSRILKFLKRRILAILAILAVLTLPYIVAIFVGVLVYLLLRPTAQWLYSSYTMQLGLAGYCILSQVSAYLLGQQPRKLRAWMMTIVSIVFQTAAMSLTVISLSPYVGAATPVVAFDQLVPFNYLFIPARELNAALWLLIVVLAPIAFGAQMARVAAEEGYLSRVLHLVTTNPVAKLANYEVVEMPNVSIDNWPYKRWLTRLQSTSGQQSLYSYRFSAGGTLYLVDSFCEPVLLYLAPNKNVHGETLILKRESVHAMSIQAAKK